MNRRVNADIRSSSCDGRETSGSNAQGEDYVEQQMQVTQTEVCGIVCVRDVNPQEFHDEADQSRS